MRVDWAGRRLGQLELLRKLGEGGMGEVWLARQEGFGREVAVKILPEATDGSAVDRLHREAQALARIPITRPWSTSASRGPRSRPR